MKLEFVSHKNFAKVADSVNNLTWGAGFVIVAFVLRTELEHVIGPKSYCLTFTVNLVAVIAACVVFVRRIRCAVYVGEKEIIVKRLLSSIRVARSECYGVRWSPNWQGNAELVTKAGAIRCPIRNPMTNWSVFGVKDPASASSERAFVNLVELLGAYREKSR